jgi:hypothetical protein
MVDNIKAVDVMEHYTEIEEYYTEKPVSVPTQDMLAKIKGVKFEIKEEATKKSLQAERAEIIAQLSEPEIDRDAWMERCEKWLSDIAFVDDSPETLSEPSPLGLRRGEEIGPVRKRRRTVEYVPVEVLVCETEESESELEESESDDDSDYNPEPEDPESESDDEEDENL